MHFIQNIRETHNLRQDKGSLRYYVITLGWSNEKSIIPTNTILTFQHTNNTLLIENKPILSQSYRSHLKVLEFQGATLPFILAAAQGSSLEPWPYVHSRWDEQTYKKMNRLII